jgi:hypothetical protein
MIIWQLYDNSIYEKMEQLFRDVDDGARPEAAPFARQCH